MKTALQSRRILQTLMYDGGKFGPPTIQKSVNFRYFVEKYARSLLTYLHLNLVSFLI